MAINLITGYDLNRTPQDHKNWGNPIKYNKVSFQNGNNLSLPDENNSMLFYFK